jgi:hypothetical protein
VAIYGAGDAAINVVKLLLLPVYVKKDYLVTADYGALGLIVAIEMVARIVSRWGLDGAFMRFFHERPEGGPLERFTSSIVWFILAADTLVFGAMLLASGSIAARLFPEPIYLLALRLMLINTFLMSLTFVPFHVMRLRNQAVTFSALALARSAGTVIVQSVMVMGLGWGLAGWVAADVVMTLVLMPFLWRWMKPLIQATFSGEDLRLALKFGLPRLPHGLAQQGLDAGNKLLLRQHVSLEGQGVYQKRFHARDGDPVFSRLRSKRRGRLFTTRRHASPAPRRSSARSQRTAWPC